MSSFVLENKLKEIDTITERIVLNINNKYKTTKNNKISRRIISKTRRKLLKKNIKYYLQILKIILD
ncbi:MAG TPA: hypothetical protein IAB38_02580 [Candidatus Onthousia excrementipullorum]|uniref:30S ribosomal protein S20 n=1 Tax=Candidatus Onthousia excrementipullorum TaxID=2840884 RepID=A0A9D1J306_9FIRM|nr:hypothetical protein [Candidatus Onthousia excrementipullorum]